MLFIAIKLTIPVFFQGIRPIKIYYEKYAIYSGGSIIAFARLEYPPHMKEQLDNVIPKIFKYFPNRRDCPPYDPNYYVVD